MSGLILSNLSLFLGAFAVPLLVNFLAIVIRRARGDPLSVGLDVYLVVAAFSFGIAAFPEPWNPVVSPSFASSFPGLFVASGIVSLILFSIFLRTEGLVLKHWFKAYLHRKHERVPRDILNARFPYFRFASSWFLVVCVIAASLLVFVLP